MINLVFFNNHLKKKNIMRQLKISPSITNRDTASLDKYLVEIGRVGGLISIEKEVELTQRIKQGDLEALQELTKANLRFVVSVAKQYQNQGLGLPDLINEGNLGLIKAAQRFDETRGFKFISYAAWWIRQGILQALAENARVVRLPLNKIGDRGRVNKASSRLEQMLGRPPSVDEIAKEMGLPIRDIEKTLEATTQHLISLDAPVGDDDETKNSDVFIFQETKSTDDSLMKESLSIDIKRLFSTLTYRQIDVLKMFYGIGHPRSYTLEEIGLKFDLTRERVRQIKEKAIRHIKNNNKTRRKMLEKYL